MKKRMPILELSAAPHAHQAPTVPEIMYNVILAMVPLCIFGIYQYGMSALLLLITCVVSCVGTEQLACMLMKKPSSIHDGSVIITGMLYALILPPGFPLWMAAIGGIFGVGVAKSLFGGMGFNCFNPALVARAFLQAAFPVAITTWTPPCLPGRFFELIPTTLTAPFMKPPETAEWIAASVVDGYSGATPLAMSKFDQITTPVVETFSGMTAGSLGESSALLILICGAYLIARRMMNWRIPASMLGTAFVLGALFWISDRTYYPNPIFVLTSGGLMLGALFMASDMVASPVTPLGVWIYGAFMGALTVIIRLKGGLPEGVMYAILLGNAVSPIIDNLTQPKIYGAVKEGERT